MHSDDIPELPVQAAAVLTVLWQKLLDPSVDGMSRRELREPSRRVAAHAKRSELSPEQLIIAIKNSWSGFHDGATQPYHHSKAQSLVTEMISLCIQEYYHPTTADSDVRGSMPTGRQLGFRRPDASP